MAELTWFQLPRSMDVEVVHHIAKTMREVRLLSLQTDPASFVTRYEDEVDLPLQFAIDRTQDPAAEHFVAVSKSELTDENDVLTVTRFHAFVVILNKNQAQEPSATREYEMAVVYVRPEHRGKGVCTQLMQYGLAWASDDLRKSGALKAVVHVTAAESNASAQRLYSKLGFQVVSHSMYTSRAGNTAPVVNMDLQLTSSGGS